MVDAVGSWVKTIAGAGIITALALTLTPKGRVHRVLRLVCGCVMVIALVSPILSFDIDSFSMNAAYYRAELEDVQASVDETSNRLYRTIIEEESCAYILDKAQVIGLEVSSVTVTAKWGDGYFYPYELFIDAQGTQQDKDALLQAIEGELGIPSERQNWNGS